MDNINDFLSDRFGFDTATAGLYITSVYICSALVTPFFGFIIDKFGRRVTMMFWSSIVFMGTHAYFAFLSDAPAGQPNHWVILGLLGIGGFYSVYAAIFWPCVPLVVEEKVVGSAYGLITALQNLMMCSIPLIMGAIHDATISYRKGYFWTEITLIGIVSLGTLVTAWMFFVDKKTGRRLERVGTSGAKTAKSRASSFIHV
eukprot:CAMPEP_0114582416 /NCGR_PEP_ID=MMETSP0125-20121206/6405_1 /TAXON_ID=485358 ORGANISM="Aristerostoma sp., Strain ATCC 50986" /NCGR_SAMPLE_ID=MMETSP0125 /ASSEMBLY_ACC=CAM_ASM_000245 /LENGTH=200 /DNA_ID=CAMNT_0001775363 /DNA_START=1362 /DNA_END=1964 /DNA_ORIENTATION=-